MQNQGQGVASAVEDRLAARLAKHQTNTKYGMGDWTPECGCGWSAPSWDRREQAEAANARHLAQVVASADDVAVIATASVAYSFQRVDGSAITSREFDTEEKAASALRQHPSRDALTVCRRAVGEWEAVATEQQGVSVNTVIEPGQEWWHARDQRTVRIESMDPVEVANGSVRAVNVVTGRVSNVRRTTLLREYELRAPAPQ